MEEMITSLSPADTEAAGEALARELLAAGTRRACIALRGEMGVGKTAFVRGFSRALGISGVRSPTYTVVNEYRGDPVPVFHFDLYRIADEDELYAIGFDDYLARDGYILCEWSENGGDMLPAERIVVDIARTLSNENERIITRSNA
ncbi:MAG: tRNA (adenosine(37)-N6)-threonylcarbamoyltransferase complex ATPase subunit type 1 TsaE [Clostridia bacterium]|nr:tRNA (adenosine(37)-N6)-threonylcarbamoyltransferase complex ATPase subunit type 1 TsaE [Clostridia bacterium]